MEPCILPSCATGVQCCRNGCIRGKKAAGSFPAGRMRPGGRPMNAFAGRRPPSPSEGAGGQSTQLDCLWRQSLLRLDEVLLALYYLVELPQVRLRHHRPTRGGRRARPC
eukprot:16210148-Heterocapsa_arctica.AAC.1